MLLWDVIASLLHGEEYCSSTYACWKLERRVRMAVDDSGGNGMDGWTDEEGQLM